MKWESKVYSRRNEKKQSNIKQNFKNENKIYFSQLIRKNTKLKNDN